MIQVLVKWDLITQFVLHWQLRIACFYSYLCCFFVSIFLFKQEMVVFKTPRAEIYLNVNVFLIHFYLYNIFTNVSDIEVVYNVLLYTGI